MCSDGTKSECNTETMGEGKTYHKGAAVILQVDLAVL
jgi:hypothetical protein